MRTEMKRRQQIRKIADKMQILRGVPKNVVSVFLDVLCGGISL